MNWKRIFKYLFWALFLYTIIVSVYVLHKRYIIEKNFNQVELVLDYNDWVEECQRHNIAPSFTFKKLKEAGITSLGLYVNSLQELEDRGEVAVKKGGELIYFTNLFNKYKLPFSFLQPSYTYIFSENTALLKNLALAFTFLTPSSVSFVTPKILKTSLPYSEVYTKRVLLNTTPTNFYLKDFYFVIRPENIHPLTREGLSFLFNQISLHPNTSCILFTGMSNEVLGYPELLDETTESLRKSSLSFGYIEVPQLSNLQKGIYTLSSRLPFQVVKVFSLSQSYQEKLGREETVATNIRGVRERNIRLLYLRPFLEGREGEDFLIFNLNYFSSLHNKLKASGFTVGKASSLPPILNFNWLLIGVALFFMALWLVWLEALNINKIIRYIIIAGFILPLLLLFLGKEISWQKVTALESSLIIVPFTLLLTWNKINIPKQLWLSGVRLLWLTSFLTVFFTLIMTVLLFGPTFLLGVDFFKGVKLLLSFPLILLVYQLFWSHYKEKSLKEIIHILKSPIFVWQILLLMIVAGAVGFYLVRSGNVGEQLASTQELKVRAELEMFLGVRPRFKEFLIGHPLLITSLYFRQLNLTYLSWISLLAGALGQLNIVDTFAHIHTPLKISLLRTLISLVLGSIIGVWGGEILIRIYKCK